MKFIGQSLSERIGRQARIRPASTKNHRNASLRVEPLEDRTVPTVVYNSAFGGETIFWGANWWGQTVGQTVTSPITNNPGALNDPTVYLIFWGKSWTQATASKYANDAQTILQSNYLSGLTDYGSDGIATYGGYTIDNSTSSLGPVAATNEIDAILPRMNSWAKPTQPTSPSGGQPGSATWSDVVTAPIYVVVSDQSWSAGNGPDAYVPSGTSDTPLAMNHIWVGVGTNEDTFTYVLSHELAERISAGGGGILMNASVNISGEYQNAQIADNEPDQGRYTYRLHGVLVQAYWSISYNAFIVPDGNSQKFDLTPNWNNTTFAWNSNLSIQGDQLGVNYADNIAIGGNGSNVSVSQNNEAALFDPGVIKNINVDTGGGSNFVRVSSVPAGVAVNVDSFGASNDTVVVGDGTDSLAGIQGTVNVSNTSGQTKLIVDDLNDGARNVTITDHSVAFSGLTTVNYHGGNLWNNGTLHGVTTLQVNDGYGSNSVDVLSVPSLTSVDLDADTLDSIYGPAAGKVKVSRNHT
jgi:hypothetical protein